MKRCQTWPLCLGLLALTLAAYLPLWNNDFIDFDDQHYITANANVLEGLTWPGFVWAWTTYHGNYWQPLTWLSLQADAQVFAAHALDGTTFLPAAAVHGHNLFWHAASVVALFLLVFRLTRARGASFLLAALFAVHPMHVESVAWAVERKDVLSCFFGILTLWAYLRYLEKPGRMRYLAIVVAFLLSLLAKPMLITLPLVLLLLDYWPLRRLFSARATGEAAEHHGFPAAARSRLLMEKLPLLVMAGAAAGITLFARAETGAAVSLASLPFSIRLVNAVTAYGWYVARTLLPLDLAVLYPHPGHNWAPLGLLASGATLVALTALAVWNARRRPWLLVGWLWFVGSLVPVIGLAQGGEQAWADRFSYWPHIGLFAAIIWSVRELAAHARLSLARVRLAGAAVVACLALLTWIQVGYWRNTLSLWQRALAATQDNHRAHANLGKHWLDHDRLDEAERHFANAVRIRPGSSDYQYFLGTASLHLGKSDEAAARFAKAIHLAPRFVDAWQNRGCALLRMEKPAAAADCFRKVLELEPGSSDAYAALGLALWRTGNHERSAQAYGDALKHNPKHAHAWRGVGLVFLARGRYEESVQAFSKALRFQPLLAEAYSDAGLVFGRLKAWSKAVAYHLNAVRLEIDREALLLSMNGQPPTEDSTRRSVLCLCRLGYALSRSGDRRGAFKAYGDAFLRDPGWPEKLAAMARRLAMSSDAHFRDPHLAYELASQAIEGAGTPSSAMLQTLALTQGQLASVPDAVQATRHARDKASPEPTEIDVLRDHLRPFQNGRPRVSPSQ